MTRSWINSSPRYVAERKRHFYRIEFFLSSKFGKWSHHCWEGWEGSCVSPKSPAFKKAGYCPREISRENNWVFAPLLCFSARKYLQDDCLRCAQPLLCSLLENRLVCCCFPSNVTAGVDGFTICPTYELFLHTFNWGLLSQDTLSYVIPCFSLVHAYTRELHLAMPPSLSKSAHSLFYPIFHSESDTLNKVCLYMWTDVSLRRTADGALNQNSREHLQQELLQPCLSFFFSCSSLWSFCEVFLRHH